MLVVKDANNIVHVRNAALSTAWGNFWMEYFNEEAEI